MLQLFFRGVKSCYFSHDEKFLKVSPINLILWRFYGFKHVFLFQRFYESDLASQNFLNK